MTDDGWEKVAPTPADDEWESVPASERPAPVIGEALPEASAAIPEAFLQRFNLGAWGQQAEQTATKKMPSGFDLMSTPDGRTKLWNAIKALPGHMLEGAIETLKTPGDVYSGKVDLDTPEGMDRALGLGMLIATSRPSGVSLTSQTAGEALQAGESISRIKQIGGQVVQQEVGSLPTAMDFSNASKVLEGPRTEANLKQLWEQQGVHPAEAVHDASQDGFLAHEIKTGEEIKASDVAARAATPLIEKGPNTYDVFHGTGSDFDQFHPDYLGSATEAPSAKEAYFFSKSHETASSYLPRQYATKSELPADKLAELEDLESQLAKENTGTSTRSKIQAIEDKISDFRRNNTVYEEGANVRLARLRMENPLIKDFEGRRFRDESYAKVIADAKAAGNDGVIFKNTYDGGPKDDIYAVFDTKNISGRTLGDVTPEEIESAFGGASLSAARTDPADIPLDVQPAKPAGSLIAKAQEMADGLFDVGRDIQMKLTPMARGSMESMATVKDYMNSMRRNAWDASRIDTDLMKNFTGEQRARMWTAMDEESTSLRLGEPASAREHQGLATLEPAERQAIIDLDNRQQLAWLRAKELGMVEGDGIVMHAPRMVINIPKGEGAEGAFSLDATGYDLRTKTPGMRQRKYMEVEETEKAAKAKYGDQAVVARDIRAVNLATSQLHDAIAGRTLIENIKDVGKRTQEETVAEGFQPDKTWFTVDHPAFKTWRPKLEQGEDGAMQAVKDAQGNPVFEQVPIYVRGDFEGPLRSAMWGKSGDAYQGLMSLKGKTMGAIMYSPMIHNMVELGRAFPTMPLRIFKAYFDGYKAKNDPAVMHEAIDSGLVPIGKRFFNQDINSIMESPDLVPGRGWTAKLASAIPGLFDEAAGTAVKKAVDKMGDFYHNTLLWDRIADLQMGLYTNFRGDLMGSGMDRQAASRIAAHWANRYAGALPKEAMSEMATKVANFAFFSRSFTLGNLGVMKDMLTGLPKDVLAQIERDARFRAGSIEGADVEGAAQQAVSDAKSVARRKAISTVAFDIALQHAGNTMLQNAFNVMNGSSWSEEEHGYLRRFQSVVNDVKGNPLQLLNPIFVGGLPSRLDATADNEPGKEGRIMIGRAKDGTGIYARNPVGKIGEEFSGYFDSPLDMMRRKEGTIMRPLMQIYSNDAGFGRKVYDPNAQTLTERAASIGAMVKHLMTSQLPMQPMSAAHDLVTGEGDKFVNELQVAGPFAGVTFSKGAPGGPAVGEMYHNKSAMEFRVQSNMPAIRKQIQRGDINGARQLMTQIGMDANYQNWTIKTSQNPSTRMSAKALGDFYRTAPQEAKDRMMRLQQ